MKLVTVVLLAVVAVAAAQAPLSVDTGIQQADEACAKAVAPKSVEQAVAFYDPEILTAGSAMPVVSGIAEIRAMWTKYFADPGFTLRWKLDKAGVTASGTIGYSSGTCAAADKPARISPSGASSAGARGKF